jgi:transcription initiation factor TFIIH subunit 4
VPVPSLSEKEKALLTDWASLGIAMMVGDVADDEMDVDTAPSSSRRRSSGGSSNKKNTSVSRFFCPTPLAWQIVSSQREGLAGGTEIGKWKRGIIVESNFMLYAYTDSEILIALLDLFAEVSTRLPNLCIAQITRRSAREAFRRGISATRIIKYLQQNRHSVHLEKQRTAAAAAAARMLDRDAAILMGDDSLLRLEATGSVVGTGGDDAAEDDEDNRVHGLPEQVAEQIQLWEEERSRFQSCQGYMYDDFDSRAQFTAVEKYARDLGVLVWANTEKMSVFVLESAHEAMKAFVRKQASNS